MNFVERFPSYALQKMGSRRFRFGGNILRTVENIKNPYSDLDPSGGLGPPRIRVCILTQIGRLDFFSSPKRWNREWNDEWVL